MAERVPVAGTHAEWFARETAGLISWPVLHEGGKL